MNTTPETTAIDREITAAERRLLALYPDWQTDEARQCKAHLEELKLWKMLQGIREAC